MNLKKLLDTLTIEEKIGQLAQVSPHFHISDTKSEVYGPDINLGLSEKEIFETGSILGIDDAKTMIKCQKQYLEKSRHQIPLIFMADIVHGYQTIFPIPLAIGSSFDLELAQKAARVSALEASSNGIHITFSPMLDLVRDPRWGRVMESFGEDPYLLGEMGKAFVLGYQKGKLSSKTSIGSCIKHFAFYGASEAGRDYNTVEVSKITAYNSYLRPYYEAIKAGAILVMSSFNIVNGLPASANKWLLNSVLRKEFRFKYPVITDFAAVEELVKFGVAENSLIAATKALKAGIDIDMASLIFIKTLKKSLSQGLISINEIDRAVFRVLKLKKDLGLFKNPFKGADIELANKITFSKKHRDIALEVARASVVLLKNSNQTLPLQNESPLLIGKLANSQDTNGSWSWHGKSACNNSLYEVFNLKKKGVKYYESLDTLNKDAQLDLGIIVLGEESQESGEAKSKTTIKIAQEQLILYQKARSLFKKLIVIIYTGRPLDLSDIASADAIILGWHLGSMSSEALFDVIYGNYNPSAKLSMTFPRSLGQVPIYYNALRLGRKQNYFGEEYVSSYLDSVNEPLYPFGYGLSYSEFRYCNLQLSSDFITKNDTLTVSVDLENISNRDGFEVVQLYLADLISEIVRPFKELIGFQKVFVKAKTKVTVAFQVTDHDLKYYHSDYKYYSDYGKFQIMVGSSSVSLLEKEFILKEKL